MNPICRLSTAVSSTVSGYELVRLPGTLKASEVKQPLLAQKILIRDCAKFDGLSNRYIRFSLKNDTVNRIMARTLVKLAFG